MKPSDGGRPRFPSLGAPALDATAPQRTGSASPPPPRASTRFPDKPPSVGREARPDTGAPQTPSRPRHLPPQDSSGRAATSSTQDGSLAQSSGRAGSFGTQDGTSSQSSGRPFRLSAPGRPAATAGAAQETTGRPFRLPPPRRPGASGDDASETTARLRPVPADPAPDEPAAPFGRPAAHRTTAARPESARPTTPPRPAHEPSVRAATGTGAPAGRPAHEPSVRAATGTGAPAGRPAHEPSVWAATGTGAPAGRPAHEPSARAATGTGAPAGRPAHEPPVRAATGTAAGAGRELPVPPAPTRRPAPSVPPPRNPTPVSPDPALSWSATRPVVSFGEPEGYGGDARPRPLGRRGAPRAAAAAACLVLGLGLISGAVTGSWLVGGSGDEGSPSTFASAQNLWHSVPVDQLFPPTVQGRGAGPGGADRTWTRIAVAPDSGCKDVFDPLLRKALAPVGCERLLRATYTDATESYVTTVGLLFTTADAPGMTALANRFRKERLDRRSDLMPLPYAAQGTPAAGFGARQRASWTVSVLTEAPVVVYAVSGWADGRTVDDPQPAGDAMEADATTAAAQAGLGNEAQGLADRVERDLRKDVRSASERPS
ncbi:hypothetical protein ACIP39_29575 [Streptomyces tibetensis]|uniref:hypothetical protein n=1 Tax=Streptomyces tibetensis TaxID=2382123 RepID=UPI0037F60A0A